MQHVYVTPERKEIKLSRQTPSSTAGPEEPAAFTLQFYHEDGGSRFLRNFTLLQYSILYSEDHSLNIVTWMARAFLSNDL
jgi:hypothetical protein